MLCGLASPTNCKTCMKGISLQRLNSRMHDPKSPSLPLPFSPSLKVWKGFLPSPVKAWKGFLPSSLPVSLDIAGVYDSRAAPSSWRLCKSTPDNEKVATPRGPQCQALRGTPGLSLWVRISGPGGCDEENLGSGCLLLYSGDEYLHQLTACMSWTEQLFQFLYK